MILIIDRKESIVRYQSGSLVIEQPDTDKQRVPLSQLDQVIVYGNPMAETAVWRCLAERNIPTAMLPGRGRSSAAIVGSSLAVQLPTRRTQHRCADNAESRLVVAKWFLTRKISSYSLPVLFMQENALELPAEIEEFNQQREQAQSRLEDADSIDVLMGVEGAVARAWFALLARYLPFKWRFSGRNRRPPRDPINALLSLGYTLNHTQLRQRLVASGFDPSLGFLHQDYPGREGLVLDFAELFRTGVDYLVLMLATGGDLDESSFYNREADGCRLSKSARPVFFKAWARFCVEWPALAAQDVEQEQISVTPVENQIQLQATALKKYISTL